MLHFNPFLDCEQRQELQHLIRVYMEVCVLEDKLHRLLSICKTHHHGKLDSSKVALVLQELRCVREWDPKEHPRWLAFEFEQRLQIRPHQYAMARHLMDNLNVISQLNMGLGKTRVILPMIVFAWVSGTLHTADSRDSVLRLHFLQPLISEAFSYLHRTMTASSQNIYLCVQPFHRDVNLSHGRVLLLREQWEQCLQHSRIQVVAVEHRLSLQLKWHEMHYERKSKPNDPPNEDTVNRNALNDLQRVLEVSEKDAINVFDESDAILHHKYHLIYAIGKLA